MAQREPPSIEPCTCSIASGGSKFTDDVQPALRVTSWNLLAPVLEIGKMFPCIDEDVYNQISRRALQQAQLLTLDSDIVSLQEVATTELQCLLEEGLRPLSHTYDYHYVAESRLSSKEREHSRGVAILWRKGFLEDVETSSEVETKGAGNPAAFVRGRVPTLSSDFLFVSKHLDALGTPPNVSRCEEQLLGVMDAAVAFAGSQDLAIIFGGDCNLTLNAPVFRKVSKGDFRLASGMQAVPSFYSVLSSARIDHVLVRGSWHAEDTEIPECPLRHCCPLVPCFHGIQVMTDRVLLSAQRGGGGSFCRPWHQLLRFLCFLPWLVAVLFCFIFPAPLSLRRCRWALQEYGSDHLPVTVTFRSHKRVVAWV